MIEATRLDGVTIMVNADLIETVEAVPDTVITLSTGRRLVVREAVREIVDRVVRYQQRVHRTPLGLLPPGTPPATTGTADEVGSEAAPPSDPPGEEKG
ncbi:MAG: flagellar FlbD family protein [Limnochordaceae bacterium]|nr:flagellar FlbD family protein [Limnochordaceae bacterium]